MAGFLTSPSASLTTGTKLITISGNVDCSFVVSGTAVYLNNILMEGVSGTSPDPSGNSTITLRNNYTGTSIVNGTLMAFNTIEGLRDAIQRARELAATQATNNSQLDTFLTNATTSVDLELPSGTVTVSPYQYISGLVLGNDVKQYAMSQVQFEAIREQNKEKYAASGFVHFGKHVSQPPSITPVNEGLWCFPSSGFENKITLGRVQPYAKAGKSLKDSPELHIAGVLFDLSAHVDGEVSVKFPQAPDGKATYNKSTGVVTTHATAAAAFNAQAADPTNVEVVINRVDMWGFETWLEEVNITNPYIYPNGLIQSQAATMDGVATSASARPVTYYAVFDGDTGSKGKGLNFFALTDVQKKKVLGNHKNNLYYLDDGRLVQWRLRQRTIAGKGNGDWGLIETTIGNQKDVMTWQQGKYIAAQGQLDVSSEYTTTNAQLFLQYLNEESKHQAGVFSVGNYSPNGINSECYFLVCGTVNRLNQGAYHPSFNPSGTQPWNKYDGWGEKWFNGGVVGPLSTISAFTKASTVNGVGTPYNTNTGGRLASDTAQGRPDGRCYDAIYAEGQGGVCRDMRYSAYGVDSVDFAEADQRVKNRTYRGFEKLVFSKVNAVITAYLNITGTQMDLTVSDTSRLNLSIGDEFYAVHASTSAVLHCRSVASITYPLVEIVSGTPPLDLNSEYFFIVAKNVGASIGGSFLQTDVIGNPANILATPALANGWQGSWGGLPEVGSGIIRKQLVRKCLSTVTQIAYTVNNGVSWGVSGTEGVDGTTNTVGHANVSANMVYLDQYQAFAKQTENAVNAAVYGGVSGIGDVFASASYKVFNGGLLSESLTGRVLTLSDGVDENYTTPVQGVRFYLDIGRIADNSTVPHNQVLIQNGVVGSVALKALNYNININQQAFIQYAYTELKYNGTNWGDDGKVTIVDNQSTKTDLNGNTVLVGTAKLKEPIGWIKN